MASSQGVGGLSSGIALAMGGGALEEALGVFVVVWIDLFLLSCLGSVLVKDDLAWRTI